MYIESIAKMSHCLTLNIIMGSDSA